MNFSPDLSNLPLGALLRAQRALAQANASDSESEASSENESDGKPEKTSSKGKEKEKPEWSIQPRPDIAKRANKHAFVQRFPTCSLLMCI
jgi:ribosomal RNA-processing protein 36